MHFGHSWNENVYLCTYAKYVFFVAEASPSVQFVTASLGNVVMENKYTKMCNNKSWKCSFKNQLSLCCYQNGLCLNVSFISGERLQKRSIIPFVTVVLFPLKYEYCVLYFRNPENKVANQAIIYSSIIPVCVFSCSVLISQRWSLSLTVSASICV